MCDVSKDTEYIERKKDKKKKECFPCGTHWPVIIWLVHSQMCLHIEQGAYACVASLDHEDFHDCAREGFSRALLSSDEVRHSQND